jgi:hypothetical protein
MALAISVIIPLIGQLLNLSLKIADIIDKVDGVDENDKMALKAMISKAKDGVTHWDDTGLEGS